MEKDKKKIFVRHANIDIVPFDKVENGDYLLLSNTMAQVVGLVAESKTVVVEKFPHLVSEGLGEHKEIKFYHYYRLKRDTVLFLLEKHMNKSKERQTKIPEFQKPEEEKNNG